MILGLAVVAGTSGCATSGRFVALKEYQPNAPARGASSLKGKSVYIAKFAYAPVKPAKGSMPKVQDPAGYAYVKLSKEQEKQWDLDFKALRKGFQKSDAVKIGAVRNGYGMTMSGVFALNDPGEWIRECLAREVTAQGATVVPDESGADLCVSGTVTWLYVDAYMKVWADLLANVSVKAKNKAPAEATYHTTGSQSAWSSSSFEFYQPIRQSLQKFMLAVLPDLEKAVQP